MNIQELRKRYPQYNDLSDQELATGFHKKFYSDLPFEDFAGRIGLKAEAPAPTTTGPTPVTSPEEVAAPSDAAAPAGPSMFQRFLEAAKPEPFTRQVLDVPLKAVEGVVVASRAATELFGANNAISQNIRGVENYLADLASAQAKQDSAEAARIMKDAEDKGAGAQLRAALQAFAIAPVDTLAQAAGSTVPILLGAVAGTVGMLGTAAAIGTGVVKGTIYDTVKEELIKAGTSPNVAEERAQQAQSYGGKNLDMILAGTALGTLAGRTGVERLILNKIVAKEAAEKGAVSAAARGAVEEAAPEFLQAAQEKLAENIALQREGFDVPTMRGVVGAGAYEAIAGGTLGAGVGVATRTRVTPEDRLIAALDKSTESTLETTTEPKVDATALKNAFATGFKTMYGREATNEELDQMVEAYEQRKLATGVAKPDVTGRIEPSFQAPGATTTEEGVAGEPAAAQVQGVELPGVPAGGVGVGAAPQPTPLSSQFTLRPELTPQEKASVKHYAALQKQPDNPVTQSLTALDTSIQKAKDAYAQIAETLGIPSGQDMIGLGVRLPTPLGNLLNYPSASGSAVRLVNASKDFTSGAKRGSQAKVDSALKQVQGEVSNVDKIIADAFAAAEDPAVQAEINRLNEQLAVNKGVAARQAEIASVPMEQRADKIKQIEDEIRAGLKTKKAKVVDLTPKLEAKEDAELEAGILEDEQRRGQAALTKEVNAEIQEALNLARQALAENSTIEKRGPTFFPEDTTAAKQFAASVAQIYEGLEKGTLPNATRSIENLRNEAANIKASLQQRIADREAYEKRSRPDLKLVSKAPTAQELEDTGAIFENELEPAKDFFTGDNDVYGVDTEGNTTKLANPEELAAFHEANKDKAEPDFTAGDAGYYVVPRERAAPATVPDAPTIKENNDAVEELNYKTARDNFLNGQFDVYHIDPEENVVPVTNLKQLQQLNAEWQGDPDAGFWSVPKAKPAKVKFTEEKVTKAFAGIGKLSQPVVDAINNNDISGALRVLASRLTNPLYKELAEKLADLNLPTIISFNNERNLTRRQIDKESGQQQYRLFTYVQLNYPSLYSKYFTNYDREENLEQVYKGIKELRSGKYNIKPVVAEFTDVNKSYSDNIRGLEVAGAYYPAFDSITLDFARATNDTFLHEVLHAATEAILEAPLETLTEGQRAAREELQKMYDYAVANVPLDLYGLTNIHEFVSELFANKYFQDRLKKIQYKPTRQPFFTRLVRTIYRMVGFDNLASNAMATATQLFSAVRTRTPTPTGARFAPKGKRVRGPISTSSWRTAEQVGVKATDEIQNAIKGHEPWGEILPRISTSMWDAGNTVFRKAILGVANLRQIDDLTKTKFPQISGAIRIIEQMIADRNRTMTKAKDILTDWTRLQARNPGQSRLMGRIMLEATIRGVDPDTAKTGTLNKEMQDAWNGLKPEFKQIYRQVRNFYADSINTMITEMKRRAMQLPKAERQKVIKEINQKFGRDKLVAPYFPLRRFGNYWFQVGKGNFKEFYEFETAFSRELAFRKRQAQLQKGNAQQRGLAKTMRKGNGISELYNQNVGTTQVLKDVQELIDNVGKITKPTPQEYKIVETSLQKQMGRTPTQEEVEKVFAVDQTKQELKESLDQLIYILLPQQSIRKMFINRQSIQGASEDMIRVFATTAVHTAYQQSRFKYAEKFVNNMIAAKEYIKDLPNSDVYDDYIKEVEKRTPTILSNEDTSMGAVVAGKLSDATFYFMLSAPFSAMLNLLGMAAITMPYIGGRYGYAKANAIMVKNLGRYMATMPKRTISPALKGQILQMQFPSVVEGGKLDPLMQRAADRFIEDNDINISQTNDIMDIGGRPSELYTGRYNTVKRTIAALFHQSERLNREVALLSTFELAYDKFLNEPKKDLRGVIQRDANGDPIANTPDEAFELAIVEAKDIAGLSLGDFTRQMKPRYFTPPLLSVLTKFKQYSVLATYVVARNFYFTVAAPFRKGEIEEFRRQMEEDKVPQNVIDQRIAEADAQRIATYQEGRRRLAGILGMTFLLGGAEALPFFTLGIGTLVKMLANDDDDEFFDWDNWFKNYMEVELGGYVADLYKKLGMESKTAEKAGRSTMEAVVRGPASVITGGSLSERVSLDPVNLWLRDPRFSTDTRESVVEGAISNAGPVVGLMVNWAEAVELMEQGQYQRAFEKAAPAIVAKPASAYRLADEGAKTKSGIKLVDNFSAWEIAMQAVGLQPERLAQKQKAAIEAKTYEQKVIDRRNTLMNRLWMERGNSSGYEAVIENVQKFNDRYPEYAIEPKTVIDSFKRRSKSQMEAEMFGAQIQKKLRPRVSPMLEYGRDEE